MTCTIPSRYSTRATATAQPLPSTLSTPTGAHCKQGLKPGSAGTQSLTLVLLMKAQLWVAPDRPFVAKRLLRNHLYNSTPPLPSLASLLKIKVKEQSWLEEFHWGCLFFKIQCVKLSSLTLSAWLLCFYCEVDVHTLKWEGNTVFERKRKENETILLYSVYWMHPFFNIAQEC